LSELVSQLVLREAWSLNGIFACGKKGTGQVSKVVSFMEYPE